MAANSAPPSNKVGVSDFFFLKFSSNACMHKLVEHYFFSYPRDVHGYKRMVGPNSTWPASLFLSSYQMERKKSFSVNKLDVQAI